MIINRKPVVVCISAIIIETNVHHDDRPSQSLDRRDRTEDNLILPKFASLAKNTSVQCRKTMALEGETKAKGRRKLFSKGSKTEAGFLCSSRRSKYKCQEKT